LLGQKDPEKLNGYRSLGNLEELSIRVGYH
jgi:hypothetical protein